MTRSDSPYLNSIGPCACPRGGATFVLHEVPTGSRCRQDKHKAPTLPYIRPLSLQDGDRRIPEFGRSKPSGRGRTIPFFGYQTSSGRVTHMTPFGRQHSSGRVFPRKDGEAFRPHW